MGLIKPWIPAIAPSLGNAAIPRLNVHVLTAGR